MWNGKFKLMLGVAVAAVGMMAYSPAEAQAGHRSGGRSFGFYYSSGGSRHCGSRGYSSARYYRSSSRGAYYGGGYGYRSYSYRSSCAPRVVYAPRVYYSSRSACAPRAYRHSRRHCGW